MKTMTQKHEMPYLPLEVKHVITYPPPQQFRFIDNHVQFHSFDMFYFVAWQLYLMINKLEFPLHRFESKNGE